MSKKQKLELTWIGKDVRPKLEPRILIEDAEKSYCAPTRTSDADIFDNRLIFGDNLLALKALEQEFTGKVKCVYIDPPYNTGNAFKYYDDGLEHSIWLGLMRDRLELLWKLLANDGLLAVQIDDHQYARLYLILEEICGGKNLKTICVKMSEATGVKMASVNKSGSIPKMKEYIVLAKKDGIKGLDLERIPKEKWDEEYKTYCDNISDDDLARVKIILDDEERTSEDIEYVDQVVRAMTFCNAKETAKRMGVNVEGDKDKINKELDTWRFQNAHRIVRLAALVGGARDIAVRRKKTLNSTSGAFSIRTPEKKMYLIQGSFNVDAPQSRCKILFADQYLTVSPGDLWTDIKTTGLDNEGVVDFPKGKKPERLIYRILRLNTQPGDLVLDSFLGSGTTAAVAHKMGRRWIGIELGEHCHTHCIPRLRSVVDGTDQGGITKAVGWKGGGGFRYFKLGPSLIALDKWGRPIIDKEKFNPEALAEAVCKIEGFTYAPSENPEEYWRHGQSSETDFIYVTTQSLTLDYLAKISDDVGPNRTLAIYCSAFLGTGDEFDNLTVKKIPQTLLKKCEWGRDDYSLAVENLPLAQEEPAPPKKTTAKRGRKKTNANQPTLFAVDGTDENGDA